MKKFTLVLSLIAVYAFPAIGQSIKNVTETSPIGVSRHAIVASYDANQVALKNGGVKAASVLYTDDFSSPNDTDGLKARGYLPYYRGVGPQGTSACWFQGSATNWGDFNAGDDNYVCSNFQSVTDVNDLDNWLVLPALNVNTGDMISFYSRDASPASGFVDSIRVMYSAAGDSTPEGLSWVELGRFEVNTTGVWLKDSFTVASSGTTARFALRSTVPNSGPNGTNGDIVGIDQLDVYTPGPVGIVENSLLDAISVYPNPSNGIIYLRATNKSVADYTVKIFNSLGEEVYSSKVYSNSNAKIDLSSHAAGIYQVQLINGTSTVNKTISITNN